MTNKVTNGRFFNKYDQTTYDSLRLNTLCYFLAANHIDTLLARPRRNVKRAIGQYWTVHEYQGSLMP